ncbi:MAG: DUF1761 domain-containing protein [Bacteroidia bacterium]
MTIIMHCWWQILVAAAAYFALGAIWFNPRVFGTVWMKGHGIVMDPEKRKEANMGMIFGSSYVLTVLVCSAICWTCVVSGCGMECGPETLWNCIRTGIMIGGVMACSIAITYLYLQKPLSAFVTDGGYHIVGSILASLVMHWLGCC